MDHFLGPDTKFKVTGPVRIETKSDGIVVYAYVPTDPKEIAEALQKMNPSYLREDTPPAMCPLEGAKGIAFSHSMDSVGMQFAKQFAAHIETHPTAKPEELAQQAKTIIDGMIGDIHRVQHERKTGKM